MKTTILTRLTALTLSTAFATLATLGVAFTMSDSGERAHFASMAAPQIAVATQAQPQPSRML